MCHTTHNHDVSKPLQELTSEHTLLWDMSSLWLSSFNLLAATLGDWSSSVLRGRLYSIGEGVSTDCAGEEKREGWYGAVELRTSYTYKGLTGIRDRFFLMGGSTLAGRYSASCFLQGERHTQDAATMRGGSTYFLTCFTSRCVPSCSSWFLELLVSTVGTDGNTMHHPFTQTLYSVTDQH